MEHTVQQMQTAVETGRTDVLRLAIDAHSPKPNSGHHNKPRMDIKLMDALNAVTPDHGTMLHLAAKLGNADVVRALLISGVDPSLKDEEGKTPYDIAKPSAQVTMVFHDILLQSVAQSKTDEVRKLLTSGLDINFKDEASGGNSALHWAASFSGLEMVQLLLEYAPDVNATNSDGATPLHDAVIKGDLDVVRELVKSGADVNIKATTGKSSGKTPLDLAEGNDKMKEALSKPVVMNGHAVNGDLPQSSKDNNNDETEIGKLAEEKDNIASSPEPASDASPQVSTPNRESGADMDEDFDEDDDEEEVEEDPRLAFLWPQPQQLIQKSGPRFMLSQDFIVDLAAVPQTGTLEPMVDLWTIQSAVLMEKGYRCVLENAAICLNPRAQVVCSINPLPFSRAESYRISVTEKTLTIVASDLPGLWHATSTFVQLVQLCEKDGLPQLEISDWPSVKHRGVLLDLSAGRVPRMDTLLQLVNTFAQLKFNELHLYVKAYKDCPIQDTMPYTGSELLDLEVFCQWRFITLVPHIDLMEAGDLSPDLFNVFQQVLSRFGSAKVINIGPNLTRKLLDSATAPCPPTGSSEEGEDNGTEGTEPTKAEASASTADKTKAEASASTAEKTAEESVAAKSEEKDGSEDQNPDQEEVDTPRPNPFILSIGDQLRLIGVSRNQTPMFCANVITAEESGFKQLPLGCVAMLYGSKSNSDFKKAGRRLLSNGHGFYVCPGTGVWNSLGGSPEGAMCNISNAMKTAMSNPNVVGLLLTNWAGCTYSNHPVLSWPAIVTAAGLAWKSNTSMDFIEANVASLINRHLLQDTDSPLGEAILEVGRVGTYLTRAANNQREVPISNRNITLPARNGSFLCQLIQDADSVDLEFITAEVVNNAMRRLRKVQTTVNAVDKLKMDRRTYIQIHLVLDLMLWACKLIRALVIAGKKPNVSQKGFNVINVGLANLSATTKTDTANKLLSMMEEYEKVWMDQCFRSGLEESGIFFKGILKPLVPESEEEEED